MHNAELLQAASKRRHAVTRARGRAGYIDAIESWRHGAGYRVPSEFVVVGARAP